MEVKAVGRDTGISPRKMRLIVDLIRGKQVDEALNILKYTPTPNARIVAKVVNRRQLMLRITFSCPRLT